MEKEIVTYFINKQKQQRILFELNHPKKREDVFWRFVNTNIFQQNCLQPVAYMSPNELESILLHLSKRKDSYFIGESYIGHLTLKQAIEKANNGEICVIYCGNGVGYYQGEEECGTRPRFLLIKKLV